MKRDMDLVRRLLLYLEDNLDYEPLRSEEIHIEGYSDAQIGYHLQIMTDGGLIDIIDTNCMGSTVFTCFVRGMTWSGHEFLDSVKSETTWNGVKVALKPVGSASLAVITSIATSLVKQQLGLP